MSISAFSPNYHPFKFFMQSIEGLIYISLKRGPASLPRILNLMEVLQTLEMQNLVRAKMNKGLLGPCYDLVFPKSYSHHHHFTIILRIS